MDRKLLLISLLFFSCAFSRSTTFDERVICEENEGVWRNYGTDCVDGCDAQFDQFAVCTSSIVYSCDCGKLRCWNKETKSCEALSSYKKTFDAREKLTKEKAEKAKEKRIKAAAGNRETIIHNIEEAAQQTQKPKATNGDEVVNISAQKAEQNKDATSAKPSQPSSHQPPSPFANKSPASIPPLFLQKEKAKKDAEEKTETKKPIDLTPATPGLPIIPLPQ